MVVSKSIVTGNYKPFEIFQKRSDLNFIHEFLGYVNRYFSNLASATKDDRKQSIKYLINEYNKLSFQKLSRILKRYNITYTDFVMITDGFFEQRFAELNKMN